MSRLQCVFFMFQARRRTDQCRPEAWVTAYASPDMIYIYIYIHICVWGRGVHVD